MRGLPSRPASSILAAQVGELVLARREGTVVVEPKSVCPGGLDELSLCQAISPYLARHDSDLDADGQSEEAVDDVRGLAAPAEDGQEQLD